MIIRLHPPGNSANPIRRASGDVFGVKYDMSFDINMPTQRYIFEIMTNGRIYEEKALRALAEHLKPGDAFFDVGANCGWFSHFALSIVGKTGTVHAWEPMADNLSALNRNAPAAIIHCAAVSDKNETAELFVNMDNDGGHSLWQCAEHPHNIRTKISGSPTIKVPCERLSDYAHRNPRALKIDTEGAEVRVLQGAEDVLANPSLKLVICEYNAFGLRQMGNTPEQVLEIMARHGFSSAESPNAQAVENWIFTR